MSTLSAQEYDDLRAVALLADRHSNLSPLPGIKTHGIRWRLALVRAMAHQVATGHAAGGFTLWVQVPEQGDVRAFVQCADCGKRIGVGMTRERSDG